MTVRTRLIVTISLLIFTISIDCCLIYSEESKISLVVANP